MRLYTISVYLQEFGYCAQAIPLSIVALYNNLQFGVLHIWQSGRGLVLELSDQHTYRAYLANRWKGLYDGYEFYRPWHGRVLVPYSCACRFTVHCTAGAVRL